MNNLSAIGISVNEGYTQHIMGLTIYPQALGKTVSQKVTRPRQTDRNKEKDSHRKD